MIRVDKGTETGTMATIHAFLRRHHNDGVDPVDTVLYGPSTSNQVRNSRSRLFHLHNFISELCKLKRC